MIIYTWTGLPFCSTKLAVEVKIAVEVTTRSYFLFCDSQLRNPSTKKSFTPYITKPYLMVKKVLYSQA